MSRYVRIVLILALVLIALPVLPVSADLTLPDGCLLSTLPSGTTVLVCMPIGVPWNNDLVIFAHGYVAPGGTPSIPFEQLQLEGVSVPAMVTGMGYAFAVTSYRTNGLAIKDGVADLVELRDAFIGFNVMQGRSAPTHTYVVGVSEGGLIATQAIEKRPDIFSGGLACCGPVGDFRKQIDYWGDFRVVYDYFFPGILTQYGGSAMNVPPTLIGAWVSGTVTPTVIGALMANPEATKQLMNVTHAASDPDNPATIGLTVLDILVYNVIATNDGIAKLGGIPFNNKMPYTWYYGSSNDWTLNSSVARFKADQKAINAINASYQTTGRLKKPLVTMHTTGDPVVPYWHEVLYQIKTWKNGSGANHINIPIIRYGHCSFTPAELVFGFGLLVLKATGSWPASAEQALPNATLRDQFRALKANRDNIVKPAVE